ncbi:hypothetical protein [Streptomyces rubellomurinus]|uniref:hypothetical protein n=1 Tax=Streptomyces rubellomurinus (strain ATCC 31215) TaxID=359131 RepID=UPI0012FF1E45|nr:hypothetical protein [Streptomyces rubellomurinus]
MAGQSGRDGGGQQGGPGGVVPGEVDQQQGRCVGVEGGSVALPGDGRVAVQVVRRLRRVVSGWWRMWPGS